VIRRDYILRMIEEFIQALARVNALKQDQRWEEAAGAVDEEFQAADRHGGSSRGSTHGNRAAGPAHPRGTHAGRARQDAHGLRPYSKRPATWRRRKGARRKAALAT